MSSTMTACTSVTGNNQVTGGQFQRLKVEDALSYLDQASFNVTRLRVTEECDQYFDISSYKLTSKVNSLCRGFNRPKELLS